MGLAFWLFGCSSATALPVPTDPAERSTPDAPVVAAQPGAWFDAQGGLTIVGPGRRLRLALTAPIAACSPAFEQAGEPNERAARASLPYHVLSEACREAHPAILLAEESETASPAELERSYHEVSRCVASELGATSGWVPSLVAQGEPCAAALGPGFRLPTTAELRGLTVDDRKAVAGALFDTEDQAAFGSLLLYSRGESGELELSTLSPNAAEQAPALTEAQRDKPFFGAALRCVRPSQSSAELARMAPRLPHAAECLRALKDERTALVTRPRPQETPELAKLKAWVEQAGRTPTLLQSEASLRELGDLLSAPTLERMARDEQNERALTEHYAELAEGLDDPNVSSGERQRRRAEFDSLRKRLGGQIVTSAETSGERRQLSALVTHLTQLLEEGAARAKSAKPPRKGRPFDYAPLLSRLRALQGQKVKTP